MQLPTITVWHFHAASTATETSVSKCHLGPSHIWPSSDHRPSSVCAGWWSSSSTHSMDTWFHIQLHLPVVHWLYQKEVWRSNSCVRRLWGHIHQGHDTPETSRWESWNNCNLLSLWWTSKNKTSGNQSMYKLRYIKAGPGWFYFWRPSLVECDGFPLVENIILDAMIKILAFLHIIRVIAFAVFFTFWAVISKSERTVSWLISWLSDLFYSIVAFYTHYF